MLLAEQAGKHMQISPVCIPLVVHIGLLIYRAQCLQFTSFLACDLAWLVQGEICDIDGTCVDAADDEIFKLTTKEGSLSMEREKVTFLFLPDIQQVT